ncbi:protein of unknown function DUF124 [Rippkaea orientalis PCC 8801]|uniref:TIGR00266 family protein n=1 Tax=Rippkaea orientalis (strain PCC 8801 / RF-1) TaxID=41431 RepID=B7K0M3_RIPO1|nr:TIGR00266 family protein [Rippkaea orientalis]ACK64177.1 protein of unknown function DUF124 [Rippkaea orientalis PCC 8801]
MPDFTYEIKHSPVYASLIIDLRSQQKVLVEASAMAAMDTTLKMESKMRGGFMKGVGRMFAGESLFINTFTAEKGRGKLYISPGVPGDIQHYYLNNTCGLMVQSSGFIACSDTVNIDTKFQGVKGFFSGESLFLLKATGKGDFWFSSYGAIIEIPVAEDFVVDTGYIVAFEDTLTYTVEMLGGLSFRGLKTGILGGDGLVCRFRGQGKLWIQSRGIYPLLNFLYPFRPTQSSD